MQLGQVIGNVWATRKEEGLEGIKLLIIQPVNAHNESISTHLVAADRIGAGIGEQVLITRGGASRYVLKDGNLPIDAVVIGIVDSTETRRDGTNGQSNRHD